MRNTRTVIPRPCRWETSRSPGTARAHELGTVRDWVVVYRDDHGGDGRWTVVTGRYGDLRGRRIVRGREDECQDYYARGLPCSGDSLNKGSRALWNRPDLFRCPIGDVTEVEGREGNG